MKKKIVLLSGFVLSLIATIGIASTASADTNIEAKSKATIKAIPGGDTPVAPVDPTDPTDTDKPGPSNPEEGNTTNQTGPLQINYLSNLDFGDEVAITSHTVTANVKNEAPRFFQVSDLRGTAAGWDLNVSLGNFIPTNTTITDKPIKGAVIRFKNGQSVTSNETNDDAATTNNIELHAGSTGVETILSAKKGTGRGTWLARFTAEEGASDNANIVFSAPTNDISADTNYQATLTWQLVDRAK